MAAVCESEEAIKSPLHEKTSEKLLPILVQVRRTVCRLIIVSGFYFTLDTDTTTVIG